MGLFIGIVLNIILAIYCKKKDILRISGSVAACGIGIVILKINIVAYILLLNFLLSTVLVERLVCGRGEKRTLVQVICNSIPAGVVLLIWNITKDPDYLLFFACLIASSTADSISSAMGKKFAKHTYSIATGTVVDKGISGGISLPGSLAGILAAAYIAILFGIIGYEYAMMVENSGLRIVVLGILGMLIDSVLGDIFQKRYVCVICNKIVDSEVHCGYVAERNKSRLRILSNNSVNLLSNIIVSLLCIVWKIHFA